MASFLTPVIKAFGSDCGFETSVAMQQVFGGHGYIKEWGMEQIVRDARICMIYEGANGVQALDLVGRKLAKDGGQVCESLPRPGRGGLRGCREGPALDDRAFARGGA